ncbi:ABC transporter permease [Palleronia abyssalis]|uniref:Glutathione transport system permease protein GsiD n=1 Tax=Palleronia abyssalis TaxID=1501240 RepID=A0A2R8BQ97_9RHOB|nr:ABC transporter permease [Palleronia abyssalis]SPJ22344.1 Glutathione transport system permease protein GsiD [Palleronia abyssalis]
MEPLTWTGSLAVLTPILWTAAAAFVLLAAIRLIAGLFLASGDTVTQPDGTLSMTRGPLETLDLATRWAFYVILGVLAAFLVGGAVLGLGAGIIGGMAQRLIPVWIALALVIGVSLTFRRRLGLYGKLFGSTIGSVGFALVMFWVFAAFFGALDMIVTHDPLAQSGAMKNEVPGTFYTKMIGDIDEGAYPYYLLGGDNLGRDVFSRMIAGALVVVQIAPMATAFAFMVGITLGLPAAYYGGRLDTTLTFLANLILAFPVILLFYLLVTPEIVATGIPTYMAAVMFVFPIVFFTILLNSRYHTRPKLRLPLLIIVIGVLGWLYLSLISKRFGVLEVLPRWLDLFDIPGGILVVFVSVVFVNSPTVFRIVRGLGLDIKTRDYVAAAQTRGEGPWYIMLWELLPNARGPLIVDFCLRVGYTTILLGTLGFFGLGLPPESPDWGSTINDGRKLLAIYPHPALAPALALLSLVLGLNLLADGLREESLRD